MTPLKFLSLSDWVNYSVTERNGKSQGNIDFEGKLLNSAMPYLYGNTLKGT